MRRGHQQCPTRSVDVLLLYYGADGGVLVARRVVARVDPLNIVHRLSNETQVSRECSAQHVG